MLDSFTLYTGKGLGVYRDFARALTVFDPGLFFERFSDTVFYDLFSVTRTFIYLTD